jgi:hypothetical protein
MKKILSILALVFAGSFAWAQQSPEHRIVFQHTTADTTAQKALMKQLGNMLSVSPTTQIEVVCNGPGLNMLVAQSSRVSEKLAGFAARGVVFNACQFSMKERKVAPEQLLPSVKQVPAGIIYIVTKQEEGFHYIKSGF